MTRQTRKRGALTQLLEAIKTVVDGHSQTDPSFQTKRLYTRLRAAEGRRPLVPQRGYRDEGLPPEETMRTRLNQ